MSFALLQIALGFALLYAAGEMLVRGSAALALGFGISPLVVGLTVVAFGTSAPELAVSVDAALKGQDDIAIGNVVGSNIANIGLIIGLSGLLCAMRVQTRLLRIDMPIMFGCSLLLLGLLLDGTVSRGEGAALAAGIVGYVLFTLRAARRERADLLAAGHPAGSGRLRPALCAGLIVVGVVGLAFGARLFVDGAVTVAAALGVSTAVIGLTVVAIGTSLPELATSIVAALRREGDLAIGNVVGSNIFNVLSILGITALIRPLTAGGVTLADVGVMLGFAAALWLFMAWRSMVTRPEAGLLLLAYVGWLGWLVAGTG